MSIERIGPVDHLGFAVRSLEKAVGFYRNALGMSPSEPEEVTAEGVRVVFFLVGESRIELLEPLDDDSPIARFIQKRGEGIHHVCLRVTSLDHSLDQIEKGGERSFLPGYERVLEDAGLRFSTLARRAGFLSS